MIHSLYAYIAIDKDGNEGIIAGKLYGTWMPFVFSDYKLCEELRKHAKGAALDENKKLKLVKFSHREDLKDV